MEIYTVHFTVERMDQCVDEEKDIEVYNIDFVIPEFRRQVKLFKKIDAVIRKPNVQPKNEHHE